MLEAWEKRIKLLNTKETCKGEHNVKIFLDCLPCFLKQVLEASRGVTSNVETQKRIMVEAAKVVGEFERYKSAPEVARKMHKIVKKYTGVADPYKSIKEKSIKSAEKVYPHLKEFLRKQEDSLYWALKISAVGNVIDAAIDFNIDIEKRVKNELDKEFKVCDIEKPRGHINEDRTVLIIGDNAGETVFDRVLLEELPNKDIVYAVRSEPIINDASIEDACESGLDSRARIISTGCNAPGAILGECSDEFINIFKSADVVISKGQGNYEALSDSPREIFFLLKAKCPVIAEKIGVNVDDYVMISSIR